MHYIYFSFLKWSPGLPQGTKLKILFMSLYNAKQFYKATYQHLYNQMCI